MLISPASSIEKGVVVWFDSMGKVLGSNGKFEAELVDDTDAERPGS